MGSSKYEVEFYVKTSGSSQRKTATVDVDDSLLPKIQGSSTRNETIAGLVQHMYPGGEISSGRIIKRYQKKTPSKKQKIQTTPRNYSSKTGSNENGTLIGAIVSGVFASNKQEDVKDFASDLSHLINYSFHGDLTDTLGKLDRIFVDTHGYKWDISPQSEQAKENNKTLNKCLRQYKLGFDHILQITNEEEIIERYKKKLKDIQRKKDSQLCFNSSSCNNSGFSITSFSITFEYNFSLKNLM